VILVIVALIVIIIQLLVIAYLVDGYRKAIEARLALLERNLENHLHANYLHKL
jgi:uncharacterized membrane protein